MKKRELKNKPVRICESDLWSSPGKPKACTTLTCTSMPSPSLQKLEKKEWLRQFESNRVGESLGHGVLSCPVPTLRTVTASPCRFGQVQRARGAAGQGAGGPWDHLLGHRVSCSWGPCCLLCTLCVHLGAACVERSVRPKHAAESSVCGGEPSTPWVYLATSLPTLVPPSWLQASRPLPPRGQEVEGDQGGCLATAATAWPPPTAAATSTQGPGRRAATPRPPTPPTPRQPPRFPMSPSSRHWRLVAAREQVKTKSHRQQKIQSADFCELLAWWSLSYLYEEILRFIYWLLIFCCPSE